MEDVNLFNPNLKLDGGGNYHLCIQGNASNLSFLILDADKKELMGIKHYTFDGQEDAKSLLTRIFKEDALFNITFKKTIFQYQSYRSMLVPDSLFDSKNLKAFLKFHHNLDENDHIHYHALKQAEAYVIFSVPVYYEEVLCSKYPTTKYLHHSIPFIYNAIENRGKDNASPCLHMNFTKDFFDVLIIRNSKIQLFNSFFYKKYTDVIYFIVNILNLYSYLPSTTMLYVSGEIDDNSELFKELKILFKVPEFEKFDTGFSFGKDLERIHQHRFVHLINSSNCV
jgi:hypothetical protein